MEYTLCLEGGSPSEIKTFLDDFPLDLHDKTYYDIKDICEMFEDLPKCRLVRPVSWSQIDVIFMRYDGAPIAFRIRLTMKPNKEFQNDVKRLKGEEVLNESIYAHGFKKSFETAQNIFGLIKDIKNYTADMDKDDAVEEAVYATADYIKDGNL